MIWNCAPPFQTASKNAEGYTLRGTAYLSQGKYDQAIAECTKAIELDPKNAGGYTARGRVYYMKEKYDLAIADYTKAIEINLMNIDAYYGGEISYDYQILSFRFGVAFDPKKVVEIKSKNVDVYFAKALACEKAGRLREAKEEYGAFIKNAPPQDVKRIENAKQKVKGLGK